MPSDPIIPVADQVELVSAHKREAATRDILEVISQSREDDYPVFDAVLGNSAILCCASMTDLEIISADRSHAVMVARWGEVLRHLVVGATAWPMDSELANAVYEGEG